MDFLVLAETCRLPRLRAKCEAFLAINFNRLKMHPQARLSNVHGSFIPF